MILHCPCWTRRASSLVLQQRSRVQLLMSRRRIRFEPHALRATTWTKRREGGSDPVVSLTELEASLVPDVPAVSEQDLAASYLRSIVPTDKSAPQWLQAVATHVPHMQRWWRCISARLVDSPRERAIRKDNLGFMLQAIVESGSCSEQAVILQSLREWGDDWRNREGHLEDAMMA